MKHHTVQWQIEVDAETYQEAAEKALAIQRNPESTATVFTVADEHGCVEIDTLNPSKKWLIRSEDDPACLAVIEARDEAHALKLASQKLNNPFSKLLAVQSPV